MSDLTKHALNGAAKTGLPEADPGSRPLNVKNLGMNKMTGIRSILIIDDEEALAKGIKKLLLRHGFAVHTAANGSVALNFLKTERIDLVITDIFMDEMEGLETIVAIKREHPTILLVAMSGGSKVVGLDCLPLAKNLGADRLLRKPIAIQTLLDTIQELDLAAANPGGRLLAAQAEPLNDSLRDTSGEGVAH